jgi:hypothetical protein
VPVPVPPVPVPIPVFPTFDGGVVEAEPGSNAFSSLIAPDASFVPELEEDCAHISLVANSSTKAISLKGWNTCITENLFVANVATGGLEILGVFILFELNRPFAILRQIALVSNQ